MTALRKLLVVDDDPVVGASFKRVLSGKGYIVVAAENGAVALERLKAEKFDAVFTDLRMPGMDGVQVAERVRAEQPWTPVVIVTGYGSPASEERARAAGVTEFLHKPLSPEEIEDSAAKAVRTVPEAMPQAVAEAQPATPPPAAEAPAEKSHLWRNMALFLAGPFIGLLYAVLLPFVGIGLLAWEAAQAAMAKYPKVRSAADAGKVALKMVATPFIGLAYIIVLPFAGLAALAWLGAKAVFGRTRTE
ncbi:MAG: response regulator [Burkholderiales bacterium]|nr:response regulator [Burkholderiales bacterium]